MTDDCQHLSWECSGAYGDVGPAGALHQCTECDKKWMSLSEFAKGDQVGVCEICGQPEENAPKFVTKDSGKREEYDSGMRRDVQTGKPRPDLLFIDGMPYDEQPLIRWASLLQRGADKYGEKNWTLANSEEELARFRASAIRHFFQWASGEVDEDHMAATWFNMAAVAYMEWKLRDVSEEDG
jgi:hypothetical protein